MPRGDYDPTSISFAHVVNALHRFELQKRDSINHIARINELSDAVAGRAKDLEGQKALYDALVQGLESTVAEESKLLDLIERVTLLISIREAPEPKKKESVRSVDGIVDLETFAGNKLPLNYLPPDHKGPLPLRTLVVAQTKEMYMLGLLHKFIKEKVEVEDVLPNEDGTPKIVQLPTKSFLTPIVQGGRVPEFPIGSEVIGLYQGTTVCYMAKVHNVPSKNKLHPNCYVLEFADDDGLYNGARESFQHVPREVVLPVPKH